MRFFYSFLCVRTKDLENLPKGFSQYLVLRIKLVFTTCSFC